MVAHAARPTIGHRDRRDSRVSRALPRPRRRQAKPCDITRCRWSAGPCFADSSVAASASIRRRGFPTEGPLLVVSQPPQQHRPVSLRRLRPGRAVLHHQARAVLQPGRRPGSWRGCNCFPVDRGAADRRALRTALDVLSRRGRLLIFLEGTRSATPGMRRAEAGVGFLARRSGAAILPVGDLGHRGGARRAVTGCRGACRSACRYGPVFQLPERAPGERRDDQAVADLIGTRIAALLPPAYRGVYAAEVRPSRCSAPGQRPRRLALASTSTTWPALGRSDLAAGRWRADDASGCLGRCAFGGRLRDGLGGVVSRRAWRRSCATAWPPIWRRACALACATGLAGVASASRPVLRGWTSRPVSPWRSGRRFARPALPPIGLPGFADWLWRRAWPWRRVLPWPPASPSRRASLRACLAGAWPSPRPAWLWRPAWASRAGLAGRLRLGCGRLGAGLAAAFALPERLRLGDRFAVRAWPRRRSSARARLGDRSRLRCGRRRWPAGVAGCRLSASAGARRRRRRRWLGGRTLPRASAVAAGLRRRRARRQEARLRCRRGAAAPSARSTGGLGPRSDDPDRLDHRPAGARPRARASPQSRGR